MPYNREEREPTCCALADLLVAAWARVLAERPSITFYCKAGDPHSEAFEQAVAFRIGHHLSSLVHDARGTWDAPLDAVLVDMELRRKSGGHEKGVGGRPDLVLHVRGNDDGNLLAVEFKPFGITVGVQGDRDKLSRLVSKKKYCFGVRAVFNVKTGRLKLVDWLMRHDKP